MTLIKKHEQRIKELEQMARLLTDNARLRAALEAADHEHDDNAPCTVGCAIIRDALAATPSDTLDALRELMAAYSALVSMQGWAPGEMDSDRAVLDDPRLVWLRGT